MNNKNITIVIDGQAGSCGKGKICGYLAKHDHFSISTNNWSSNAGHTYVEDNGEKIIVSHLPIAMLNPTCKLVLNAGCIITPEIIFEEIRKYRNLIGTRKIYIHPRAMIILEKHREEEKRIIRSGSTFKGCGSAQSEKIMRNPNVTSKMCSASQLIADAGCSPFKVKDIYMIIRPYPIRISNKTNIGEDIYSGDYGGSTEITWNEVKNRCGCNIDLEEYTTVTKKVRRVFEMNWDRLKYNVMINQPTQIVLNFAQYIDWKAYRCKHYNELPFRVKEFIKKIEDLTNTPVTIIGTGERNCDIIDLRHFFRNNF